MDNYNDLVTGLTSMFLDLNTRSFFERERDQFFLKQKLEQERKDRLEDIRKNLTRDLVATGSFTELECEFLSIGTLHSLLADILDK